MHTWFDHILFHTRTRRETPAMVMEDRAVTYGMLGFAIENCARRILALNLPRDVPVAIIMANPIRTMTLALALFRIGLPSISVAHGQPGLNGVRPSAVLGDAHATRFAMGHRLVEVPDSWFGEPVSGDALPTAFHAPGDVCRLSLTSGSTSTPKLLTHRVMDIGQRVTSFNEVGWNALLCMPGLAASYGFTGACAALAQGRTAAFAESPYQALRMIDLFALDAALTASEQLVALTRVARKTRAHLRSLRAVWVGGEILTRALLESAAIHVCRDIICRYGASETGAIAHASVRDVLADPGLAGFVLPGVEVGVFDAKDTRCSEGATGAIRVRRLADTQTWIDLGDVGRLGPDGRLYVLGRAADLASHSMVSPVHEFEHLARLEWDLGDAAAVLIEGSGAPAQVWLGVVDGEDVNAEGLAATARARGLAHPVRIVPLQAIPRGVNGKVNRAQLKALLLAETGKAAVGRTQ